MDTRPTRTRTALWVLTTWWLAHIALIGALVLLVFLYSVAIAPGLENSEYESFAMRSGPWLSIVAGGPVFYLIGRLLRRRVPPHGRAAALTTWALYTVTDAVVVALSLDSLTLLFSAQWVASQTVKLVAVLLATRESAGGSTPAGA